MRDGVVKLIVLLWALPMVLFWGWYALSLNDLNLGTIFLSRELHDLVFRLYGRMLGVPPDEVPAMVASACAFDTAAVLSIVAWRWRDDWYPQTRDFFGFWLDKLSFAERVAANEPLAEPDMPIAAQDGPARPAE